MTLGEGFNALPHGAKHGLFALRRDSGFTIGELIAAE